MLYYSRYDELKALITYIGNNIGNWLTYVQYEGIERTNNFAEQALLETVIVRRIIGAFRSEICINSLDRAIVLDIMKNEHDRLY